MDHDGGIRPTITGGIKLEMAASTEYWEQHSFPLLLCNDCYSEFAADRSYTRFKKTSRRISIVFFILAVLIFVFIRDPLSAAVATVSTAIALFISALFMISNPTIEPYIIQWLSDIRWFEDAFSKEDEYTLVLGETRQIK